VTKQAPCFLMGLQRLQSANNDASYLGGTNHVL